MSLVLHRKLLFRLLVSLGKSQLPYIYITCTILVSQWPYPYQNLSCHNSPNLQPYCLITLIAQRQNTPVTQSKYIWVQQISICKTFFSYYSIKNDFPFLSPKQIITHPSQGTNLLLLEPLWLPKPLNMVKNVMWKASILHYSIRHCEDQGVGAAGAPHGQPEPIPPHSQGQGSGGGLGQPQPWALGISLGIGWCQGGKSPIGCALSLGEQSRSEAAVWWEQWILQRPSSKNLAEKQIPQVGEDPGGLSLLQHCLGTSLQGHQGKEAAHSCAVSPLTLSPGSQTFRKSTLSWPVHGDPASCLNPTIQHAP